MIAALPAVVRTDVDRAEARAALLTALPTADPSSLSVLVAALTDLDPSDADLAPARNAVSAAAQTDPWILPGALRALVHTDTDRADARAALLAALPAADPITLGALVAALHGFDPDDADRDRVSTALLAALPTAYPETLSALVATFRSVSPISSWLAWLARTEETPAARGPNRAHTSSPDAESDRGRPLSGDEREWVPDSATP